MKYKTFEQLKRGDQVLISNFDFYGKMLNTDVKTLQADPKRINATSVRLDFDLGVTAILPACLSQAIKQNRDGVDVYQVVIYDAGEIDKVIAALTVTKQSIKQDPADPQAAFDEIEKIKRHVENEITKFQFLKAKLNGK